MIAQAALALSLGALLYALCLVGEYLGDRSVADRPTVPVPIFRDIPVNYDGLAYRDTNVIAPSKRIDSGTHFLTDNSVMSDSIPPEEKTELGMLIGRN